MVVDGVRLHVVEQPHHFLGEPHVFIGINGLDAALAAGGDKREEFRRRLANQRDFSLLLGGLAGSRFLFAHGFGLGSGEGLSRVKT